MQECGAESGRRSGHLLIKLFGSTPASSEPQLNVTSPRLTRRVQSLDSLDRPHLFSYAASLGLGII